MIKGFTAAQARYTIPSSSKLEKLVEKIHADIKKAAFYNWNWVSVRILYEDFDEDCCERAKEFLESEGYHIQCTNSEGHGTQILIDWKE